MKTIRMKIKLNIYIFFNLMKNNLNIPNMKDNIGKKFKLGG